MSIAADAIVQARRLGQVEHGDSLPSRNSALVPGEFVRVRLRRYERDRNGELQELEVPYQKGMRVLDALNWIAENALPDLAYRWYCGSKMCGTCALRMKWRATRHVR